MADLEPFHALRYDEATAGPLGALVAPPYDVIGPAERDEYRSRSPYNVVRLTLPDSEEQAARDLADWRERGVLVRDAEPALWWLGQEYVGPDGVSRTREGLVGSLRVEPYETGAVLPHERTHAGPKEGRLRLLRATRTQLEPIFLLHQGTLGAETQGPPLLEASEADVTSRLWRIAGDEAERLTGLLAGAPLLIADGHHRYETALAYAAESGSDRMIVVVAPTEQPGLTVFPTHRIVRKLGEVAGEEVPAGLDAALERLAELEPDSAAAVLYRGGRALLVRGEAGELDAALVERLAPEGVEYTPLTEEAARLVDAGEAEAAFLLRAPTVAQVAAVAAAGETMPQKSTFFYPKLLSGLLLHPL